MLQKKLGEKIRNIRKAKGLTQEQLAEMLDIDNKHLSRIEKGKHMPTYAISKKLSEILKFDIFHFEEEIDKEIPKQDDIYLKSLKILNSAKNQQEKEYYYEALKLAKKGLRLGKNLA